MIQNFRKKIFCSKCVKSINLVLSKLFYFVFKKIENFEFEDCI